MKTSIIITLYLLVVVAATAAVWYARKRNKESEVEGKSTTKDWMGRKYRGRSDFWKGKNRRQRGKLF
jgi:hypothetical protein